MVTNEFDEIRPYHDNELSQVIEELIADPDFQKVTKAVYPEIPFEKLAEKMRSCQTKRDFQLAFAYPLMWGVARDHSDGLSMDYSALQDKSEAYTYMSNHRDIVLDSGFLSILLADEGLETVEIAIGDNLLIYPWIKKLVRINKSFIVQRGLSMRQMLESSARMSRYMHYTINEKKQSIWIAQREGRAKDSDDRTQESVLKMLAMGGEGDVIERLSEMHIVPLSISYEYDPCDFLKAQEFQLKRDVEGYKKTMADDLRNMQTGIFGYKGRVHFKVAPCISSMLLQLDRDLPKTEIFNRTSTYIDKEIHRNYRLYPGNYIAYDMLNGCDKFTSSYTSEEKQRFEEYVDKQLAKVEIDNPDIPYLRSKILLMYSNPLVNYLAAQE